MVTAWRHGRLTIRERSCKIKILVKRTLNDSNEHRIVEARPPTLEAGRRSSRFLGSDCRKVVKRGEVGVRPRLVRTYRAARNADTEGKARNMS
jgi:hypothetical protein